MRQFAPIGEIVFSGLQNHGLGLIVCGFKMMNLTRAGLLWSNPTCELRLIETDQSLKKELWHNLGLLLEMPLKAILFHSQS